MTNSNTNAKDEVIVARSFTLNGARETAANLISHGIASYYTWDYKDPSAFGHIVMVRAKQQDEARELLRSLKGLAIIVVAKEGVFEWGIDADNDFPPKARKTPVDEILKLAALALFVPLFGIYVLWRIAGLFKSGHAKAQPVATTVASLFALISAVGGVYLIDFIALSF